MEQNKKFNKLSVFSLILILVGPLLVVLDKLKIYLPKGDHWEMYVILSSFILGFIFALISLNKIKKSGEKGRILASSTITIFIILTLIISYSLLSSQGHPKSPNSAIRSLLASMRAQGELYYQSTDESFVGLCNTTQTSNGFGGINGPGLLFETIKYSKGKIKCFSDKDSWVVSAELKNKPQKDDLYYGYNYYCVDSLGNSKDITEPQNDSIINADTLCPQ